MAVLEQEPVGLAGHTHVIGRTRTGKSYLLAGWVLEAVRAGYGVLLVDPHGELYQQVLDSLIYRSMKDPALISRVFLFDPTDARCPGLDPLRLLPGENVAEGADHLTDAICNIAKVDSSIVVQMRRVMRNLFKVLIETDESLSTALRFLTDIVNTDPSQREKLLKGVTDPYARMFFIEELPKGIRGHEYVNSTRNRLDPLLANPRFEALFNRSRPSLNPLSIIEGGSVVLVNCPKDKFGEEAANLLSAFVVTLFQQAAIYRRDMRKKFWMVLDEFHGYTSRTITALLSETGKYNTLVLLANQFMSQITDQTLHDAVLSQVTDQVVFQVGEQDAETFSQAICTPDTNQIKFAQWRYQQLTGRIYATPDITFRPLEEVKLALKNLFTDRELRPRQFYFKRRTYKPIHLVSHDFEPPKLAPHIREKFLEMVAPPTILPGKARVVKEEPYRDAPKAETKRNQQQAKETVEPTENVGVDPIRPVAVNDYIPLWAP